MSKPKIDEWALHAFVDGEVSEDQRAEIEAYLASDAEAAAKVEAWRAQTRAMQQAFAGVAEEPLPASLLAAARSGGGWRRQPFAAIAAALALLLLGGAGGWFMGHDTAGVAAFSVADRAIVAHEVYAPEVRHPVEVAASEKDHLEAWLSKRVGVDFKTPDLSAQGYTLLGGRLLAGDGRPAAQLMYEDAHKSRLTVFIAFNTGPEETAVRIEEKGALVACYWLDGQFAVAVAGEMPPDDMMKLAQSVYDQLES